MRTATAPRCPTPRQRHMWLHAKVRGRLPRTAAPSNARAGSSSVGACTAAAASGISTSHGEASTLVAADHQATVAPPIWKLCASGTWHSCTLHKHARHRLTPSGWTSSWTHTDGRCYNIFFPGVMSTHACSSDLPPSGGTEGVVPYPIGGPGRHDYVSIKVCHSLDSMPFPTAPRAPRARSDQQPIILSQVARSRLPSSPLPAPPPPPLLSLTGWEGVPHQVCTHAYTGTHSYACICAYVCICTYMCRCVCMCASQPGAAVLTMSHRHPPPSPTPTPSP